MTRPRPPDDHPPAVLECPKCGARVILDLPGTARCLPCARPMRQVTSRADRPVKA